MNHRKLAGIFTVFLLVVPALPNFIARAENSDFSVSMAVDMRSYSGPGYYDEPEYFRGVCEAIGELGAGEFMLSPGDIDPPADVYWTIQKYIGSDYLWYPGVGNHEAETPSDMAWLRNFNPDGDSLPYIVNAGPAGCEETTYSFDFGNTHFIQINEYYDGESDTGTYGDVTDALYNWLEADLQSTLKEHIIVLGHEPAWPQPDRDSGRMRHLGDSLDQYPDNRDRFWVLLREYNVAAYLCGHTHNFSAVNIDGVWQIDGGHSRGIGDTGSLSTFLFLDFENDLIRYRTYRGVGTAGEYSLYYSEIIDSADSITHSFQDGRYPSYAYQGTEDTYLDQGGPHGSDTPLIVDGDPDSAALIKWDLSEISQPFTADKAWIVLNVNNSSIDSYEIYELKKNWIEQEADWNQYADGHDWEEPGAGGPGDHGSTALGDISANHQGMYITRLNQNGIALINSWIENPSTNYGIILVDYAEGDSVQCDSSEYETPAYRPKLTIQGYPSIPTITPTTEPEPSVTPTFVASPTPADEQTGVDIWMNKHEYRPGDSCGCWAMVSNFEGATLHGYHLFAILDIFGIFFYGPDFTEIPMSYLEEFPLFLPGNTLITILSPFEWPADTGQAQGIRWIAGLTDPEMTRLLGNHGAWEFGWTE